MWSMRPEELLRYDPARRLMARVARRSRRRVLKLIDGFLKQEIMSDMARWLPTTERPRGGPLADAGQHLLHPLDL